MSSLDELARTLRTADLVDAMGRLHHHRAHILDLVTPTPDRVMFGPAATVSFAPACSDRLPSQTHSFGRLFDEAVGPDPEGKVLVLASNGYHDTSVGGGTKFSRLHSRQLAGLLTDGRCRDFAQLAAYDFTTFCHGEATRWGGDEITPYEAGRVVVVSKVLICPGDYVFADNAGAVVIPSTDVERVLETAAEITTEEEEAALSIQREGLGGETTEH